MSFLADLPVARVQFYATAPYPCSYLQGEHARIARSQVATPASKIDTEVYSDLVALGFRRSGTFIYRPWCDTCNACTPLRVDVNRFKPNRTQRRLSKTHATLDCQQVPRKLYDEHYDLYLRYQAARHAGGGMDTDNPDQYEHFLLQSMVNTELIEFRDQGRLVMVSLVDVLDQGVSSVYTYFDPSVAGSLGTYNILWQIEYAKRLQKPYLYLGYWIAMSPKMSYKANFKPCEGLIDGAWQAIEPNDED